MSDYNDYMELKQEYYEYRSQDGPKDPETMRWFWAEFKRLECPSRCRLENGTRCTKSCRNCSRRRESNPLSLDALSETGTEAVDVFSLVCDTKRKAWCCKIANQAYRLEL